MVYFFPEVARVNETMFLSPSANDTSSQKKVKIVKEIVFLLCGEGNTTPSLYRFSFPKKAQGNGKESNGPCSSRKINPGIGKNGREVG
jgi:hypothetical protein